MKRLSGDAELQDLNLEYGELVRIVDTVYLYCGVVKRNGKEYDKIVPVANASLIDTRSPAEFFTRRIHVQDEIA